ncbi:MAG: 4-hydroxy-tetrahydrodipicolinate synthase [Pseudomonadota bacterium]
MTALVTPFHQGAIDVEAYQRLVERQVEEGTAAVVPVGTTGETSTLSLEEHIGVVKACVEATAGKVPVIAGVGANNTAESISLAEQAAEAGANGLLAVTGYYNRPSQDGLIAHFTALADATDLPVILYNVPSRTACDISVETMAVLARHPRIAGVKDATGNLARVARQRLACGEDFIQLSGEDATALGFNAMGGVGCISVAANIAPRHYAEFQNAMLEGRWDDARALQDKLTPLSDALFADTSPGPAKYALAKLGLCQEELRLPLVPASEKAKIAVTRALEGLDLI